MSAPLLVISVAVTGPCQRSIAAFRPVSPQMHCRGLAERARQGAQAREGDVGRASRASRAQVKRWSSKDAAGPGAPSPDGSRFPSAVPCVKDNLNAFPAYPSPRHAPVVVASSRNQPKSGSSAFAASTSAMTSAGAGGSSLRPRTRGGDASTVGLMVIQPHRTTWCRAGHTMACTCRRVAVESGLPSRPPSSRSLA